MQQLFWAEMASKEGAIDWRQLIHRTHVQYFCRKTSIESFATASTICVKEGNTG
jgi:hypothetical protein